MSFSMSAVIIGSKELKEAFDKSREVVNRELGKAVLKAAHQAESKAKEYAPIQYGFLRGSIYSEGPFTSVDNIYAKVGTNIEYAKWQEEGTGVYAGRGMITPKRARILAWKDRGGQWHVARAVRGVKGKFFFKRAKEETLPKLTEYLREALTNIISSLTK